MSTRTVSGFDPQTSDHIDARVYHATLDSLFALDHRLTSEAFVARVKNSENGYDDYVRNATVATSTPTNSDHWDIRISQGPRGEDGVAGVQGRSSVDVFRRFAVVPTEAPTGGSFNFETNTLAAPDDWFTDIGAVPSGSGEIYESRSTIDPANPGATLIWSVPFQAGSQGPAGPQGIPGIGGMNGSDGTDARVVKLTVTDQAISYNADGLSPSPNTVTVTAEASNTSGVLAYRFTRDNIEAQASSSDNTFTYIPQTNISDMPDIIEVEVTEDGTIVARDQITIFGVRPGVDAYTVVLSNEAHTLPATNAGTIDYRDSGTTVTLFKGTARLSAVATSPQAGQYRVTAGGTSITPGARTVNNNSFVFADASDMTATLATISFSIEAEGIETIIRVQSLSQSVQGADGEDGENGLNGDRGSDGVSARGVNLSTNQQAFTYDANGLNPTPANSTITATAINTTGDVFYRFLVDGTQQGTISTTNTFTYSPPSSVSDAPQVVRVEIREGLSTGPVLATDQITIVGIQPGLDGEDAYTILLSNEAHTLPTTSAGVVDYTGSGTTVTAYVGATQLTAVTGTPGTGEFSVSTAGTNVTPGSITLSGTDVIIEDHSAATQDVSSVTYSINVENSEIFTKVQSLSKSRDGMDGVNGAAGSNGAAGDDARGVELTTNRQVFDYDANGNSSGTRAAIITARGVNTIASPFYRFLLDNVEVKASSTDSTYNYTAPADISGFPDIIEVEMRETVNGVVFARDQISLFGVQPGTDGLDAYTVVLSNEAHALPTTNTGVVDYNGSGTEVSVFRGTTRLTGITSGTPTAGQFSITVNSMGIVPGSEVVSPNGITFGDHSGATTNSSTITFSINLEGIDTAVKIQSLAKSRQGTDGLDGDRGSDGLDSRAVNISATTQAITYNADGTTPSPTSVELTAVGVNSILNPFYRFLANNNEVQASSTDNTNTYIVPSDISNLPVRFEVELRETVNGPVLARDQITLFGVQPGNDGEDAYTVFLSNEAHTLPATTDGTITYTGSGTSIRAFLGSTALAPVSGTPIAGQFSVSAVGSSIAPGSQTISSGTRTISYGDASNATADSSSITFSISLEGEETFVREQSFSISRQGDTGLQGPQGLSILSVFRRFATVGDVVSPVGGSYDFSTNTLTAPANWTETFGDVPAGAGEIYESRATVDPANQGSSLNWSTPFQAGSTGPAGPQGDNARAVGLTASVQVFEYQADGTTPAQLSSTITATQSNATGATFYRFLVDGVEVQASSSSSTYTHTAPTNISTLPDRVEVELREGSSTGAVVAADQITLFGVRPGTDGDNGEDAYTIVLSNESHTLPETNTGVINYTNSGTNISVLKGTQVLTPVDSNPQEGEFTVATTSSGITPGTGRAIGPLNLFLFGEASGALADSSTIVFTIDLEGLLSVARNQTFAISRSGLNGAAGSNGAVGDDGRVVNLTASTQVVEYNADSTTPSPTSVELTAEALNTEGSLFYTFFRDNNQVQAASSDNTFTYSPPANIINLPTTFEVEVREGTATSPIVARDQITISGVRPGADGAEGADAYTVVLTNESHSLPTTNTGVVDYVGSGTGVVVYRGSTLLTGVTGTPGVGEFSVSAIGENINPGIRGITSGVVTFGVANGAVQNASLITYSINVEDDETFTKIQSFSKSTQGDNGLNGNTGAEGANARSVDITTDQQAFTYTADGARVGAGTATITATAVNTQQTSFYRFSLDGIEVQASSSDNTYSYTSPANISGFPELVQVELREGSATSPVIATDQISLFGIQPGADGMNGMDGDDGDNGMNGTNGVDAYTVVLSNESHALPTTNTGLVDYTNSGTTITVYRGITQLTGITSGTPGPDEFSVSANGIGVTPSTDITLNGDDLVYGEHSNATLNSTLVVYTINVENQTSFTKEQSLSKSIEGSDGSNGTSGTDGIAYAELKIFSRTLTRASRAETDSTLASFDEYDGSNITSVPNPIYNDNNSFWNIEINVSRRELTFLNSPVDDAAAELALVGNMLVHRPSDSDRWRIAGTIINSSANTNPNRIRLDRDSTTADILDMISSGDQLGVINTTGDIIPPEDTTVTFGADGASWVAPAGWSRSVPTGTDQLYVSYATSTRQGFGEDIASWTNPAIESLDGANGSNGTNGVDGLNSAIVYIYQSATTTPDTPTGTSTVTFAESGTSLSNIPNGWSEDITSTTVGQMVYRSQAIATSRTNTDSVSWGAPALFIRNGVDGAAGSNGSAGANARSVRLTSTDQAFVYNAAGLSPSPGTATITATAVNTTGIVFYEFFLNDVSVQNTDGSVYTYTPAANEVDMPQIIEVQIREGSATSANILARDQITMFGVRPGSDGVDGPFNIEIFTRATSTPATPTGGNYVISTDVITAPSTPVQWFATAAETSGSNDLYVSRARIIPGTTPDSSTPSWNEPTIAGAQGPAGENGMPGANGADAYTIILTNEAHTVPVSNTGVFDYSGSGTSIQVFRGETRLIPVQSGPTEGQFGTSILARNNITEGARTVDTANGQMVYADASGFGENDAASITFNVNVEGNNLIARVQSFSKSRGGTNGENGRVVSLSTPDQVIEYSSAGTSPNINQVEITATSTNVTGTPFYAFLEDGSPVRASSTDNSHTFSVPTNITDLPVVVSVELRDGSASGAIVGRDQITILGIRPGSDGSNGMNGENGMNGTNGENGDDAYTVLLTNEAHTVPVSNTGVVNYSGSGTSVVVFRGTTRLSPVSGNPSEDQYSVTAVPDNISIPSQQRITTAGSQSVTYGDYNSISSTEDLASVTFNVNIGGLQTVTKIQSISKSVQGADGMDGTNGTNGNNGSNGQDARAVRLTSSSYAIPFNANGTIGSIGSVNLTSNATNFNLARYSVSRTFAGGSPVAVANLSSSNAVNFTVSSNIDSYPIQIAVNVFENVDASTVLATDTITLFAVQPGVDGENGEAGDTGPYNIEIFRRFATAPTTAPTGGSYNIGTDTITPPTGWFTSAADTTGSDDLYLATARITPANTNNVSTPSWGIPTIAGATGPAGMNGTNGTDAYTVILTNEAHTLPTSNTGVVDYNNSGTNVVVYRGATQLSPATGTVEVDTLVTSVGGNPLSVVSFTGTTTRIYQAANDNTNWNINLRDADIVVLVRENSGDEWQVLGTTQANLGANLFRFVIPNPNFIIGLDETTWEYGARLVSTDPGPNQFSVEATGTNITPGSSSVSGNDISYGNHSAATTDASSINYAVNVEGDVTINKVQSLSKSREGSDGQRGDDGTDGRAVGQVQIYQRSASAPTVLPTTSTFNFLTGALVITGGANNWNTGIPTGTNPLWTAIATVQSNTGGTGTITINASDWSDVYSLASNGLDGESGDAGRSAFQGSVFRLAASQPSPPTGGSYNFGTNTLVAPNLWSVSPPSVVDGQMVYISTATFTVEGTTGTDIPDNWSTPTVYAVTGEDGEAGPAGLSTYQYPVYLRSASEPNMPTGGSFNFGTNTGTPPSGGWTNEVPTANGNPLYVSTTLASFQGSTGTDTTLTWSSPSILADDGSDGQNARAVRLNSDSYAIPFNANGTIGNRTSISLSTGISNFDDPRYIFTRTTNGGSPTTISSDNTSSSLSNTVPTSLTDYPVQYQITVTEASDSSISATDTITIFEVRPGADGVNGNTGPFDIQIFRRFSTAPTDAPTGGSYNITTDTITPPTDWAISPSEATGTDDLYLATARIVPGTTMDGDTPNWGTPTVAGAMGPAGAAGMNGEDAYTVILTNESHTIPVLNNGSIDYTGSGTRVLVYKGATQLSPFGAAVEVDTLVTSVNGDPLDIVSTTGTATVVYQAANDNANWSVNLRDADHVVVVRDSAGSEWQVLGTTQRNAGANLFRFVIPTPNSIPGFDATTWQFGVRTTSTIPGEGQYSVNVTDETNITADASPATINNDVVFGNASAIGAGNTASITYDINLENIETVQKFQSFSKSLQGEDGEEGADAYSVILSNDSHTIPVTNGGVANFTGSGTDIRAFRGNTQLTATSGTPTAGQFSVTVVNSTNITADSTPGIAGNIVAYGNASNITADTASLTYRINLEGTTTTIDRVQTFSRANQGQDGVAGQDGYSVAVSNEAHSIPVSSAGVADFTGSGTSIRALRGGIALSLVTGSPGIGQFRVTVNDSNNIQADSTPTLSSNIIFYGNASNITADTASITFRIELEGLSTIDRIQTFSRVTEGTDGDDGNQQVLLEAYIRSATEPDPPANRTVSFTASGLQISGSAWTAPSGWGETIASAPGTGPLWISQTTIGGVGFVTANESWTTPGVDLDENGVVDILQGPNAPATNCSLGSASGDEIFIPFSGTSNTAKLGVSTNGRVEIATGSSNLTISAGNLGGTGSSAFTNQSESLQLAASTRTNDQTFTVIAYAYNTNNTRGAELDRIVVRVVDSITNTNLNTAPVAVADEGSVDVSIITIPSGGGLPAVGFTTNGTVQFTLGSSVDWLAGFTVSYDSRITGNVGHNGAVVSNNTGSDRSAVLRMHPLGDTSTILDTVTIFQPTRPVTSVDVSSISVDIGGTAGSSTGVLYIT